VLACADDTGKVKETNEGNNCLASTGLVVVGMPDLITTQVTGQPASAMPGGKFTLTDTVTNQGNVTAIASKTRYYLSLDGSWSAGDVLMTGTRGVVALAPSASSTGNKQVTVPAGTPSNTYYVLACADDLKKVTESDEGNNCVASASTIVIGP
jgi:subtilase family serine protease